jgi:hypothetical protein
VGGRRARRRREHWSAIALTHTLQLRHAACFDHVAEIRLQRPQGLRTSHSVPVRRTGTQSARRAGCAASARQRLRQHACSSRPSRRAPAPPAHLQGGFPQPPPVLAACCPGCGGLAQAALGGTQDGRCGGFREGRHKLCQQELRAGPAAAAQRAPSASGGAGWPAAMAADSWRPPPCRLAGCLVYCGGGCWCLVPPPHLGLLTSSSSSARYWLVSDAHRSTYGTTLGVGQQQSKAPHAPHGG